MVDVHAVVDLWSEGTRAEAALDHSVASRGSIIHCCTATGTCTIIVILARHTFTFVFSAIC